MKVTIEQNELVIRIALTKPTPSKTGKTKVVAKTSGFMPSGVQVDGKDVKINLTAII